MERLKIQPQNWLWEWRRRFLINTRPARIFGYPKLNVSFLLLRPVGFEKQSISVWLFFFETKPKFGFSFETEVRFFLRNWSTVFPSKLKFGLSNTQNRQLLYSPRRYIFLKKMQFKLTVYTISVMPNLLYKFVKKPHIIILRGWEEGGGKCFIFAFDRTQRDVRRR